MGSLTREDAEQVQAQQDNYWTRRRADAKQIRYQQEYIKTVAENEAHPVKLQGYKQQLVSDLSACVAPTATRQQLLDILLKLNESVALVVAALAREGNQ